MLIVWSSCRWPTTASRSIRALGSRRTCGPLTPRRWLLIGADRAAAAAHGRTRISRCNPQNRGWRCPRQNTLRSGCHRGRSASARDRVRRRAHVRDGHVGQARDNVLPRLDRPGARQPAGRRPGGHGPGAGRAVPASTPTTGRRTRRASRRSTRERRPRPSTGWWASTGSPAGCGSGACRGRSPAASCWSTASSPTSPTAIASRSSWPRPTSVWPTLPITTT